MFTVSFFVTPNCSHNDAMCGTVAIISALPFHTLCCTIAGYCTFTQFFSRFAYHMIHSAILVFPIQARCFEYLMLLLGLSQLVSKLEKKKIHHQGEEQGERERDKYLPLRANYKRPGNADRKASHYN
jgi:hypothetical protein